MKHFILAAAFAVSASVASASVIDFEDIVGSEGDLQETSGGFTFDFHAAGWLVGDFVGFPGYANNGSNSLTAEGDRNGPASVVMTKSGGGSFDLSSLDAAGSRPTIANTVNIMATLFGGGTVSQMLNVNGTFGSFLLSGFEDVVSVTFTSGTSGSFGTGAGFSLDNLNTNVSAVPLPGSLPLLLAGLGGIVVARRRKQVN